MSKSNNKVVTQFVVNKDDAFTFDLKLDLKMFKWVERNPPAKALIAMVLADSQTGRQSLVLLLGLTALGLLPLLWVAR